MPPRGAPDGDDEPVHSTESLIASAREALRGAMQVAEAALALLRAELRLARSSALSLVWLGFALIFFGASAWLAISAAIATAIYQLTGNPLLGAGAVALANLAAVAWVVLAMRRCWRDLSLPRTRALLIASNPEATNARIESDPTRTSP
jgi:hypothetical protein